MTCPTCGLTVAALGWGPDIDPCPRCRARRGEIVEMMARRRPSAKLGPGGITDPSLGSHARSSVEMRSPRESLGAPPSTTPPPSTTLKDSHAAG